MRNINAKFVNNKLSISIWSPDINDPVWDFIVSSGLAREIDISPTYEPEGYSCHFVIHNRGGE